jgi:hypothetical protein
MRRGTTQAGAARGGAARVGLMRAGVAAALSLVVAAGATRPAEAGDREFDAVVRRIETTYKTKRVRVPLTGLARLAVRIARPEGVKSFKLAAFENLSAPDPIEAARLGEVLRNSLDAAWRPLARVRSRGGGEQTFVYLREDGRDVRLMVVSVEPAEATVVRVRVGRETLARWMNDPGRAGIKLPKNWGG